MWLLKFMFIVIGVLYELLHYSITSVYNALGKILSTYYKTNKGQA